LLFLGRASTVAIISLLDSGRAHICLIGVFDAFDNTRFRKSNSIVSNGIYGLQVKTINVATSSVPMRVLVGAMATKEEGCRN
jgi:hypothetical protein